MLEEFFPHIFCVIFLKKNENVKTTFEYYRVFNVRDLALWNLGENNFPKFKNPD
jgi:hypothetical protein